MTMTMTMTALVPAPMMMTALVPAPMTAPGRVARPALVAARMPPVALVARMPPVALVARVAPVALAGRVPVAQFRVAPAVLARIRLIVARAGARVRFPVIGVTRVAVVAAARAVTGGRRAWPLMTRRVVTGRLAGRPGPAGAPARGPPGQVTPDRPAVPAPKAGPRTQPQTRPGQIRPVQIRPVQIRPVQTRLAQARPAPGRPVLIQPVAVTVIRACLVIARRSGTVHSVTACPALAPARRAGTRTGNQTTCRR
jgi:hypothetical protein